MVLEESSDYERELDRLMEYAESRASDDNFVETTAYYAVWETDLPESDPLTVLDEVGRVPRKWRSYVSPGVSDCDADAYLSAMARAGLEYELCCLLESR